MLLYAYSSSAATVIAILRLLLAVRCAVIACDDVVRQLRATAMPAVLLLLSHCCEGAADSVKCHASTALLYLLVVLAIATTRCAATADFDD
jgi:hypothetical protein